MKIKIKDVKKLKNMSISNKNNDIVICKHCKKLIKKVSLVGFSLICPFCKKPQNGY